MTLRRIVGIVLLVAGLLALVYGGFTYTKETHDVSLGSLQVGWKEKARVNVPAWAGVAAVVVGVVLLVERRRR